MREHMESENRHDFDTTMRTFTIRATRSSRPGRCMTAKARCARYFEETRAAFPDQRNEMIALHHADDAVVVEFDLLGTHLGRSAGCRRPAGTSAVAWSRCSCSRATGWWASGSTSTPARSCASSDRARSADAVGQARDRREPPAHDRPRRGALDRAPLRAPNETPAMPTRLRIVAIRVLGRPNATRHAASLRPWLA